MYDWIIASTAAFFIKGLCGFANTLVFTTILSFRNNNINISPVELVLGYPSNLILAWRERKAIQWSVCIPVAILVLVGSISGIFFLKNADIKLIKVVFGFVIIAIGIEMLFREFRSRQVKQSRLLLAVIGVLSGFLCGLYGVGALLGAYISRVTSDSHEFKGNICFVFAVENTLRILFYITWGILTRDILWQAVKLSPFMLGALLAGMAAGRVLDERFVRRLVIVMLIISGFPLIAGNLG